MNELTIRKNPANQGKLGEKSGFWSIFSGFTLTVRVITLKIFTNKLIWFTTNIRVSSIRFRQYTLMVRCFQNKYLPLILGSFPYTQSHYPDISEEDISEEDISEGDISEEDISEADFSEEDISDTGFSEENISEEDIQRSLREINI